MFSPITALLNERHPLAIIVLIPVVILVLRLILRWISFLQHIILHRGNVLSPGLFMPRRVEGAVHGYGVVELKGRRPYMEDRHMVVPRLNGNPNLTLYGVFDGHGGDAAAEFCAKYLGAMLSEAPVDISVKPQQALTHAFKAIDNKFLEYAHVKKMDDGTTAIAALANGDSVVVANTGDSRAVLVQGSGRVLPLSKDHKPDRNDERDRIAKLGGSVVHWGVWRVEGILAVSRAIGDRLLKEYVIPDPEFKEWVCGPDDMYIVLATDGLWDVIDNDSVARLILNCRDAQDGAEILTQEAFKQGSMDNVTVLVIDQAGVEVELFEAEAADGRQHDPRSENAKTREKKKKTKALMNDSHEEESSYERADGQSFKGSVSTENEEKMHAQDQLLHEEETTQRRRSNNSENEQLLAEESDDQEYLWSQSEEEGGGEEEEEEEELHDDENEDFKHNVGAEFQGEYKRHKRPDEDDANDESPPHVGIVALLPEGIHLPRTAYDAAWSRLMDKVAARSAEETMLTQLQHRSEDLEFSLETFRADYPKDTMKEAPRPRDPSQAAHQVKGSGKVAQKPQKSRPKPTPSAEIGLGGYLTSALVKKKQKRQTAGRPTEHETTGQRKPQAKTTSTGSKMLRANPNALDSTVRSMVRSGKSRAPGTKKRKKLSTLKKQLLRDRALRWKLLCPGISPIPLQVHPAMYDYVRVHLASHAALPSSSLTADATVAMGDDDGSEVSSDPEEWVLMDARDAADSDDEVNTGDVENSETVSENSEGDLGAEGDFVTTEVDQSHLSHEEEDLDSSKRDGIHSNDQTLQSGLHETDADADVSADVDADNILDADADDDAEAFVDEERVGNTLDTSKSKGLDGNDSGDNDDQGKREDAVGGNDGTLAAKFVAEFATADSWDAKRVSPMFFGCPLVPLSLVQSSKDSNLCTEQVVPAALPETSRRDRRYGLQTKLRPQALARSYVDQALSPALDEVVTRMLSRLMALQERLRLKDQVKSQMRRRLVFGLREVMRGIRSRRCVCIVVAYNIEQGRGEELKGIDHTVREMIDRCTPTEDEIEMGKDGIPVVFALTKTRLGKALNKRTQLQRVPVGLRKMKKKRKEASHLTDEEPIVPEPCDIVQISRMVPASLAEDAQRRSAEAKKALAAGGTNRGGGRRTAGTAPSKPRSDTSTPSPNDVTTAASTLEPTAPGTSEPVKWNVDAPEFIPTTSMDTFDASDAGAMRNQEQLQQLDPRQQQQQQQQQQQLMMMMMMMGGQIHPGGNPSQGYW
ncbi:Protein phosphatase, putative [Hondaea fermentalgiana]|uniref:Protein phosphatase, putative n=1 Tax=Hondaea fermentalgiana TaxID=2315210 RepID=A0A2R5GMV7_9STRA|nr:Protein phosphatase, putative [Hondaea fermentalgiana]|eukprot:GBG29963.1 Protein phosphatase, putative [Hondaea fermentalgiana]